MDQRSNKSSEGAFQEHTVIRANLASSMPDSMSYESACVLPLGMSTAACELFMKDFLALPFPTVSPKPAGKTLPVWGGSISVVVMPYSLLPQLDTKSSRPPRPEITSISRSLVQLRSLRFTVNITQSCNHYTLHSHKSLLTTLILTTLHMSSYKLVRSLPPPLLP